MNSGKFKILKRCSLLLQCILLVSITFSSPQQINAKTSDCVQVAEQWGDWLIGNASVGNVTTVNTKTGRSTIESEPIIAPSSWFSPNGKYAIFWQMIQGTDDDVGLYVGSVADKHIQLLYRTTRKNMFNTDWRNQQWSPDSSKFAYTYSENKQNFIAVVNAINGQVQTKPASPKVLTKISRLDITGWSADSKYFATSVNMKDTDNYSHFELQVRSANDLSEVSSGILLGSGALDDIAPMAWSLNGHQLAIEIRRAPNVERSFETSRLAPLAIWSPEHGIEAITSSDAQFLSKEDSNYYHKISWSPDGQYLRIHINSSGFEKDIILDVTQLN